MQDASHKTQDARRKARVARRKTHKFSCIANYSQTHELQVKIKKFLKENLRILCLNSTVPCIMCDKKMRLSELFSVAILFLIFKFYWWKSRTSSFSSLSPTGRTNILFFIVFRNKLHKFLLFAFSLICIFYWFKIIFSIFHSLYIHFVHFSSNHHICFHFSWKVPHTIVPSISILSPTFLYSK